VGGRRRVLRRQAVFGGEQAGLRGPRQGGSEAAVRPDRPEAEAAAVEVEEYGPSGARRLQPRGIDPVRAAFKPREPRAEAVSPHPAERFADVAPADDAEARHLRPRSAVGGDGGLEANAPGGASAAADGATGRSGPRAPDGGTHDSNLVSRSGLRRGRCQVGAVGHIGTLDDPADRSAYESCFQGTSDRRRPAGHGGCIRKRQPCFAGGQQCGQNLRPSSHLRRDGTSGGVGGDEPIADDHRGRQPPNSRPIDCHGPHAPAGIALSLRARNSFGARRKSTKLPSSPAGW
jgi:hypothetical protein